jgi:hypothetical protein
VAAIGRSGSGRTSKHWEERELGDSTPDFVDHTDERARILFRDECDNFVDVEFGLLRPLDRRRHGRGSSRAASFASIRAMTSACDV